MPMEYSCPHCHCVLNPNVRVVLAAFCGEQRGLVLMSSKLGDYKLICDKGFCSRVEPGDMVDFHCPVCSESLTSKTTDHFSEANAKLLAEELAEETIKAEEEWKQIDRNLLKWFGAELGSGIAAAGPMIASGYGQFLAAAVAVSGITTLGATQGERKSFKKKYPAAFFLKLK